MQETRWDFLSHHMKEKSFFEQHKIDILDLSA